MLNRKLRRSVRDFRHALNRYSFTFYAKLKYRVRVWRLLNKKAIEDFQRNKPLLSTTQLKLVDDLEEKGISVTSLAELFPNKDVLSELLEYTEKRKDRARTNHKKIFLEDLLPEIPELGPEIPFFNLAIDPIILDVVNSYMGMHCVMHHFMLRQTIPSEDKLPAYSQNWHRAPQEKKNCRVYIYLTDVDEKSGPFMYIPYSTINKKWFGVAQQDPTRGGYLTAEQVEGKIPKEDQMTILGKAGTVIFCDTTGLHRGGYSKQKSRIMSTFGYGAPTLRENIHYSFPSTLHSKLSNEPKAVQEVLNKRWMRASH